MLSWWSALGAAVLAVGEPTHRRGLRVLLAGDAIADWHPLSVVLEQRGHGGRTARNTQQVLVRFPRISDRHRDHGLGGVGPGGLSHDPGDSRFAGSAAGTKRSCWRWEPALGCPATSDVCRLASIGAAPRPSLLTISSPWQNTWRSSICRAAIARTAIQRDPSWPLPRPSHPTRQRP